jgi:hypothetical protein
VAGAWVIGHVVLHLFISYAYLAALHLLLEISFLACFFCIQNNQVLCLSCCITFALSIRISHWLSDCKLRFK